MPMKRERARLLTEVSRLLMSKYVGGCVFVQDGGVNGGYAL